MGSPATGIILKARIATLLMLTVSANLPAAQYAFGDFSIHVASDEALAGSERDYQIIVEDQEALVTRLTASHAGQLSNSFVEDLDKDGAFEVVVTFSFDDGHQTGVHLYSWQDHRLQPHRVAALDGGQQPGYRGNDEFAVSGGHLVRIFQLYEQADGEWQPTAQQRRLRYSIEQARWIDE